MRIVRLLLPLFFSFDKRKIIIGRCATVLFTSSCQSYELPFSPPHKCLEGEKGSSNSATSPGGFETLPWNASEAPSGNRKEVVSSGAHKKRFKKGMQCACKPCTPPDIMPDESFGGNPVKQQRINPGKIPPGHFCREPCGVCFLLMDSTRTLESFNYERTRKAKVKVRLMHVKPPTRGSRTGRQCTT